MEDERIPTATYSLTKGDWINRPNRDNMAIDYDGVTKKVSEKMAEIEELENLFQAEEYEEAYEMGMNLRSKLRGFRQSGLDRDGEYSNENLAFKVLRRSKSLDRLNDITKQS
jgi:hypothetical protein